MHWKSTYFLIAIATIGLSVNRAISTQAAPKPLNSTIAVATPSSRTTELTQSIGAVEVERAILLARSTSDVPTIQQLSRRYTTLLSELRQLAPARYQALASSATQSALLRKVGEIEVERAIALSRLTNAQPVVQTLDRQSILLEARLKQLAPARYQALASSATQSALRAKIAELQALYQQEDRKLIPSAPSQKILSTQIVELNRRLAEVSKN